MRGGAAGFGMYGGAYNGYGGAAAASMMVPPPGVPGAFTGRQDYHPPANYPYAH